MKSNYYRTIRSDIIALNNIIDTVIIESDEALYNFLEELSDDDNALVVSLNYPVTLVYANGETVEVNSNQELSDAIEAAEMDCEDNVEECDISLQELENILLECGFDAEGIVIAARNLVLSKIMTRAI